MIASVALQIFQDESESSSGDHDCLRPADQLLLVFTREESLKCQAETVVGCLRHRKALKQ